MKKLRKAKRFFRTHSAVLPLTVIALSVVGIFYLLALNNAKLAEQVRYQNELIEEIKQISLRLDRNAQDRSKQIDGIDRHLDCIVYFFSQKDRTQKAIENIEECRISVDSNPFIESYTPASPQAASPPQGSPHVNNAPEGETPLIDTNYQEPPSQLENIINSVRDRVNSLLRR